MIVSRPFAMARPARPRAERLLVVEAAGRSGTIVERATRLARAVATTAMGAIDRDEADRVIELLRQLAPTSVDELASGPDFATGDLILRERVRRLEARGGKRLRAEQWAEEDREVLEVVVATLARRYRNYLSVSSKKLP